MPEEKNGNKLVLWAVVVLVLVVAIYGLLKYVKREKTISESPIALPVSPTANPSVSGQTVTPVSPAYKYKDGTYNAVGNYNSPGGAEEIDVKVTLKSDLIAEVQVVSKATRPASKNWQSAFISGVSEAVVGKSLDNVVLDKVSGSSLTPKGWNNAVSEIQEQAKA
jgi:uncharacterized protein with FMN-binding domain